jgi:glutamyl-tRNA synthetase
MTDVPRVRFAPSPTGYLHVGSARTALFNWLFARQQGGVFVLRIEDTDRDRSSDEMSAAILDSMSWLGLNWDEGPYHQADGFERHRADVDRMIESGSAYHCFCSVDDLKARREAAERAGGEGNYRYDRRCAQLPPSEVLNRVAAGEPYAVRFHVAVGETEWDDLVHGPTRFRHEEIDDFIILRTDGTPIYNLAVVSDDVHMRITHVLRGDDHLSNTPKQIMLYRALGAPEPRFGHLPMILGPDGRRLSKRHGATAVGEYREAGILPQALNNFLALLGWNPGDDQEVMLEHELIARFSIDRIGKKSAIFDPEKLEWMNGQHIMVTPAHELLSLIAAELVDQGLAAEAEITDRADWLADIVELLKPRSRTLGSMVAQMRPFLAPAVDFEPAAVAKYWKDPAATIVGLTAVREAFDRLTEWTPESIEAALRQTAEGAGVSFGKLVHPLRLALTGSHASPGIDQVVWLTGQQLVGQRIEAACGFLRSKQAGELHG